MNKKEDNKKEVEKGLEKEDFVRILDTHVQSLKDLDNRITVNYKLKPYGEEEHREAYSITVNVLLQGWKGPRVMLPRKLKSSIRLDIDLKEANIVNADIFLSKWFGKLKESYEGYLKLEEITTQDVPYIR